MAMKADTRVEVLYQVKGAITSDGNKSAMAVDTPSSR